MIGIGSYKSMSCSHTDRVWWQYQIQNLPDTSHVDMIPGGLYVNGKYLAKSHHVRVFVVSEYGAYHPVELSDAELRLFQPDTYPDSLLKSDLWKERLLPLVDPYLIAREKEQADIAAEQKEFADLEARGIKRDSFGGQWGDDVFGMTDWICHPDGSSQLLCAFITRRPPVNTTLHHSNLKNDYFEKNRDLLVQGNPRVFFEIYPSHYSINGEPIEPGKPYVQRPDGTVEALVLTPEESQQFTLELFSSSDGFLASDLFKHKIGPLIGPPIPKDTPVEAATP